MKNVCCRVVIFPPGTARLGTQDIQNQTMMLSSLCLLLILHINAAFAFHSTSFCHPHNPMINHPNALRDGGHNHPTLKV